MSFSTCTYKCSAVESVAAMISFTPLERDILDCIATKTQDFGLAAQCRAAVPTLREYTGVGFFVSLSIPAGNSPVIDSHLLAPVIFSGQLEFGGGVVLFTDNGQLSCLEIYANGDSFPETLSEYSLRTWEEAAENQDA